MTQSQTQQGESSVTRSDLYGVPTPQRTSTWVPIPHFRMLEEVERSLKAYDMETVSSRHLLTKGGERYFGVLHIGAGDGDEYETVIGLRNSHDKSFVAGLACGSHVFVCSNLAFWGDVVISRKHTEHIERDLRPLVSGALGRLVEMRHVQEHRVAQYKETTLGDVEAHDVLVRAMDAGVISASRLPRVLSCWRGERDAVWGGEVDVAFEPGTAWRLFNAFTFVLKGIAMASLLRRTQRLHVLMDQAVGLPTV